MSKTIFTKIIEGEIPANKVYEDDQIIAFHDIEPKAALHLLIVPKKPIPTINDLEVGDAELVGQLFLVAKRLAKEHKVADDGYRVIMNCGEGGGQTVFHMHLHLLAGPDLPAFG